jgi:hypothetical protein
MFQQSWISYKPDTANGEIGSSYRCGYSSEKVILKNDLEKNISSKRAKR